MRYDVHHTSSQAPTSRANPLFPRKPSRFSFPRVVIASLAASGALFLAGLFATDILQYGPIIVDGTHAIRAADVEASVRGSMTGKTFGVFRRDATLLFSTRAAEKAVQNSLASDSRFERVVVTTGPSFLIRVQIIERVPNIIYTNGGQEYLVDRKGLITAFVSEPTEKKKEYPTVLDQTTGLFTVGDHAMSTSVVDFLFAVREQLRLSEIPIETYFLPPASCLNIDDQLQQPLETIGQPLTNSTAATSNAHVGTADLNTNAEQTDTLMKESGLDRDEPAGGVATLDQSCDLRSAALQTPELRARSTEGWELYFRVTDDAKTQVARLLRVLREQRLDRDKLHYVDLRFGDRVIYL